jgi:hypothetical protein
VTKYTLSQLKTRLEASRDHQEALQALSAEIGAASAAPVPADLDSLLDEIGKEHPAGALLERYLAEEFEPLFKDLTQREVDTGDPYINELLRVLCALRLSALGAKMANGEDPLRFVCQEEPESLAGDQSVPAEVGQLQEYVMKGKIAETPG